MLGLIKQNRNTKKVLTPKSGVNHLLSVERKLSKNQYATFLEFNIEVEQVFNKIFSHYYNWQEKNNQFLEYYAGLKQMYIEAIVKEKEEGERGKQKEMESDGSVNKEESIKYVEKCSDGERDEETSLGCKESVVF